MASKHRISSMNFKWRLLVVLLSIIWILWANDYLQAKYFGVAFTQGHPEPFVVSEKIFYWFITGFLSGILAFAIMLEGEFILSTRSILRKAEEEVEKRIALAGKRIEKELHKEAKVLGLEKDKKKPRKK